MKNPASSTPASAPFSVSPDEISRRAREIWLSRGSPIGQDVEIWLLAERELSAPPLAAAKTSARKTRTAATRKNPGEAEVIDVGDLQDGLSRFGEPPQRSPTSLDLS
jgi:hypothetical protein